jgi:hypothetical protein
LRISCTELPFQTPERCLGEDPHGVVVFEAQFPEDVGALVLVLVLDDEAVVFGQGAAFVGAAVSNAGPVEADARSD